MHWNNRLRTLVEFIRTTYFVFRLARFTVRKQCCVNSDGRSCSCQPHFVRPRDILPHDLHRRCCHTIQWSDISYIRTGTPLPFTFDMIPMRILGARVDVLFESRNCLTSSISTTWRYTGFNLLLRLSPQKLPHYNTHTPIERQHKSHFSSSFTSLYTIYGIWYYTLDSCN